MFTSLVRNLVCERPCSPPEGYAMRAPKLVVSLPSSTHPSTKFAIRSLSLHPSSHAKLLLHAYIIYLGRPCRDIYKGSAKFPFSVNTLMTLYIPKAQVQDLNHPVPKRNFAPFTNIQAHKQLTQQLVNASCANICKKMLFSRKLMLLSTWILTF